jgi:hypothetical protein
VEKLFLELFGTASPKTAGEATSEAVTKAPKMKKVDEGERQQIDHG